MPPKKPPNARTKKPLRGGRICAYSPLPAGKKALKNDTKSPCIFTRKCHKAGVWVIENFFIRLFIFAISW